MHWDRALLVWLAIVWASEFALAAGFAATGAPWSSPLGRATWVLSMLPPLLGALGVQGAWLRRPVLHPLGIRPRIDIWLAVGWIALPLLGLGASLAVASLAGSEIATSTEAWARQLRASLPAGQRAAFDLRVRLNPPPPPASLVVHAVMAGGLNAMFLYGHEIGWRGLLGHVLRGSWWRKGWLAGALWAVALLPFGWTGRFHAAHPGPTGALLTAAWALLWGPPLQWLRERSGSVLASALCLGSLTALGPVTWQLVSGADDRLKPLYGLYGLAGAALLNLMLLAVDPILVSGSTKRR